MTSTSPTTFPYGDATAVPAPDALTALRGQAPGVTAEAAGRVAVGTRPGSAAVARDRADDVAVRAA
jgi:hypothetical protein